MAQLNKSNLGGARLSNIELLRLLCMLMVLNLHSFAGWQHGSGFWQAVDFFRESTSICAVDCFVLISGYFGIHWKFKSFFNLVFQIFFYSIVIYLFAVCIGIVGWSLTDFAERFECLFAAEKSWGFAVSYVLLYFCAPLLNALADRLTSKELLIFIIVLFVAINFICLPDIVFTYALVYLIGRLIRKSNMVEKSCHAWRGYWGATILIFLFVYVVLFKVIGVSNPSRSSTFPLGFIGYSYSAPLVIMQAVFLFLGFAKMNFSSKVVNWCATSCFAIFLIHMHPTIKEIGYYSFTTGLYEKSVFQHIVILMGLIIVVFVGSILIDKIRIVISNGCFFVVTKAAGFIEQRRSITSKINKCLDRIV